MLEHTTAILFEMNHAPLPTEHAGVYLQPTIDGGFRVQSEEVYEYIDHYPTHAELSTIVGQ